MWWKEGPTPRDTDRGKQLEKQLLIQVICPCKFCVNLAQAGVIWKELSTEKMCSKDLTVGKAIVHSWLVIGAGGKVVLDGIR